MLKEFLLKAKSLPSKILMKTKHTPVITESMILQKDLTIYLHAEMPLHSSVLFSLPSIELL